MLFAGAPRTIKFASGENPKRVYGSRNQLPSTRMGNFEVMRQAFEDAKVYRKDWDEYDAKVASGDKTAKAPHRDLKLEALADVVHDSHNLAASISSGSYKTDGMIVVPCSMRSASAIAYSLNDTLLVRAADVCLKEKRRVVLVVRETPLHLGHLRTLTQLA